MRWRTTGLATKCFLRRTRPLGMGEGLPEYATIVVEEAHKGEAGPPPARDPISARVRQSAKEAKETPLGVTMMTDPLAQRRIALAKAPLFFVALEDACGEEPMRSGLRQMVTLLRGQETSYDALRSALEESCGKNLAELFRVWLNEREFRPIFARVTARLTANAELRNFSLSGGYVKEVLRQKGTKSDWPVLAGDQSEWVHLHRRADSIRSGYGTDC